MRILIDTNVILDIIQKREPFFADSYQALRKAIEADTECLISVSAATDIFYMLRKAFQSAQKANERIEQLSQIVTFADVQVWTFIPHSCAPCQTLKMLLWMP